MLAIIMASFLGWLLRQTFGARPWADEDDAIETYHSEAVLQTPPARIGLWAFLAVVTSLFALFLSAYSIRMELPDWRALEEPKLLWLNTAFLIFGSVAFQRARDAAASSQIQGVKTGLILGGMFTIAFLAGQLWAWQQLNAAGFFLTSNPANAFFYLLTALHGLHLLGGLWFWAKATVKVWNGAKVGEVQLTVQLCTVYWHFLLLVWLVLFGLLLST